LRCRLLGHRDGRHWQVHGEATLYPCVRAAAAVGLRRGQRCAVAAVAGARSPSARLQQVLRGRVRPASMEATLDVVSPSVHAVGPIVRRCANWPSGPRSGNRGRHVAVAARRQGMEATVVLRDEGR
jgi:hypothetical protein